VRGHGAKRDANEPIIVEALEAAGWLVIRLSAPGMPDLLCVRRGVLVLMEVKMPKGSVTPKQAETFLEMLSWGYRVPIIRSVKEAVEVAEALSKGRIDNRAASSNEGMKT
jgi:hypothetical protein